MSGPASRQGSGQASHSQASHGQFSLRRSGWRAVWGTGAAGTVALGFAVLCCVFLATAGPRASLAMRTQALRRQLAAAPAL